MNQGDDMESKNNKISVFVIILSILLILGILLFVVFQFINIKNTNNDYSNIASSYASDITKESNTEITSPSIDEKLAENPIDFASIKKQNDEIYSWIYIPNTNINYPVCQSKSNDNFYLDHDIYKNYSFPGAIYSQSCNKTDYSDRVTLLYGHNMIDGSMFADLHKYSDADFFNKNKYMYIYTENKKLTYEIASAFIYDDRHIMNSFNFSNDDEFQEYLDTVSNPRSVSKNVREGLSLTTNDKIVTLSTCLNSGQGRYLVQWVLINDERTK